MSEDAISGKDIREFRLYLKQCTDRQVEGVFEREKAAGRETYMELARAEAEHRGITIWG